MITNSKFYSVVVTISAAMMMGVTGCAIAEPIEYITSAETPTRPAPINNPGGGNSCNGSCVWAGGGDFGSGSYGDKIILNWILVDQQVKVGIDMIASLPTPTDPTLQSNSPNGDRNTAASLKIINPT